jgi:uncharacterized membrane protein
MNQAHWHLVLNHLPIIIPAIGLLITISGFLFKSEIRKSAAYCIYILGGITAIGALSIEEGAVEPIEGLNGIDERLIEVREETAEMFSLLLYILGGLSLIGVWANFKNKSFSKLFSFVIIAFTLIVLIYAKQTGTTGGEIRYTEIRAGGLNSVLTNHQNSESQEEPDV